MAAKLARGIIFSIPPMLIALISKNTPCSIADSLVFAPKVIFAELRTITWVTGKPPIRPETILPRPCAGAFLKNDTASYLYLCCLPVFWWRKFSYQTGFKARRVRAIKFSIKIFQRPEMSWGRRNKKHSAISFSQNVPGAFKRKLIARRIALGCIPKKWHSV